INEYGWNASPPDFPEDKLIWGRVTEQQQADYTVRGIRDARDRWPWIGVFNVWYFRQVGDIPPDRSDYYFRMVDIDFTPRLVYLRLKEAATFPVVAQPGLYEETNPAVELSGPAGDPRGYWQPYLNPRSSAGSEVVTRQPGARATIKFWGDGIDLIMRRGPTLGRAWVTLDGQKVPGLPLDANGNSFVELSSPNDEFQVHVPVARDLTRGTHTVEVVVGQSGEVSLDGFVVSADGLHEFPWEQAGAFAAGLIVAAALLAVSLLRSRRNTARRKSDGQSASD
ncbi:MAG: hypothetical protein KGJ80_17350, partial [Chloroflexota bacterium]|nr:hypothetical protein [Chloroflexota bacterium]